MNGETTLRNLILATDEITALLTTYKGRYCVAAQNPAPKQWPETGRMINLYNGTGVDEGNQALITDITVNLRGDTEKAVKELEAAFVPAVHGYRIPNGQGQFYCASLPMIEPSDTSDSYNKPITVSVKAVRGLE